MSNVSNAELLQKAREEARASKGYQRITALFDEGTFNEVDGLAKSGDGYAEVVAGYGLVDDCPVYAFAQNSDIAGGAMSKAQASKIKKVYDLAVKTGAPVVGIYDSIGGRLAEGADMLAAYGDILKNSAALSGVVPQISLVLGPCIGTSAMIAANADIIVMSEQAELTIATSGANASASEAAASGLCSLVGKDEAEAVAKTRELLAALPSNNLSGAPAAETAVIGASSAPASAQAMDVISSVADPGSFLALSPSFGQAAVTGLAQISGASVGLVAYTGELDADACSKAARFVRFCDAFSIPVVSFVDATEFTSLREAVKLSSAYAEATTGKITVITGEAYGPVYIAVAGRGANTDYAMAWADAVVSPMAPAAAALFLHSGELKGSANPVADRKALIEAYKKDEATPFAAAAQGFIEDVILPEETRDRLIANLAMLSSKRVSNLPKKHSNIQL
ncbi:MAG TPA: carboxyl transferase [Candidatus Caccousia avistercoris]|nr:carboxyl transferase [Candidatus Caccousia avistercoris]